MNDNNKKRLIDKINIFIFLNRLLLLDIFKLVLSNNFETENDLEKILNNQTNTAISLLDEIILGTNGRETKNER
ncbi:hypothetical protein SAMN04488558_11214 [Ignavigranum ruoffiae]|uniref:Uncharacterized protein n=1 Tax=Ignavigranum ruoffiae TaxID=89093 RepID=A0A1H9G971_9LACT|nr:hypothetical protein [Ignavigranum ruoffiae]SEQ46639.1 hypothetical protein SAMN04488558_11214 [Ignavigranum ruoffiae]